MLCINADDSRRHQSNALSRAPGLNAFGSSTLTKDKVVASQRLSNSFDIVVAEVGWWVTRQFHQMVDKLAALS